MKTIATFIFSFIFATLILGQDVAPFQWEDINAKTIDSEVLEALLYKNWHCYERKFRYKGLYRKVNPGYQFYLMENGTCTITLNGKEEPGTWHIENNNLLVFNIDNAEDYVHWNHNLLGGHALYKIDETGLILVKTLTSDFDNKIILYFDTQERHQVRVVSNSNKFWNEKIQNTTWKKSQNQDEEFGFEPMKDEKEILLEKIKRTYAEKGLKLKPNLELLTKEELEEHLIMLERVPKKY